MESLGAPCPAWMVTRFEEAGGTISFRRFMELALHDPDHGAYGAGILRVGPDGDFVTSPSMGTDFAALLALQLVQWFDQLAVLHPEAPLCLVDIGPGEGDLAADLITELNRLQPEWLDRLELILVEVNQGMAARQRKRLDQVDSLAVTWRSLEQLSSQPLIGVFLAHELLDALPVERLVNREGELNQLLVTAAMGSDQTVRLQWAEQPLPEALEEQLQWAEHQCDLVLPPAGAPEGWTTEWHHSVPDWLQSAAGALGHGVLLIVDYAHEAARYYSALRSAGTLLAYRHQKVSNDLLGQAGLTDLTAHLCIDTLIAQARQRGWLCLGHCRQGEALLSLGLAERLHNLQRLPTDQLALALQRREALLRLVDPGALGDFRWIALQRCRDLSDDPLPLQARFLEPPSEIS